MAKIRILVVDDHAIMREGIHALLGMHSDLEIAGEASDGREALEKVQELSPDVVVMDISMPNMDGLEATRRIAKKYPRVKVLVLTQHDNKEYILSTIKAGAAGYVPKRALGSELVSAIRAVHRGDSFLYPSAATALIEEYRDQAKATDPYDQLTSREREILKLVAEGKTSRQIADMLYISLKTVLGHRAKLMEKLDLHNRTELIKYAMQKGLLNIGS
ncbi:MAG: response regulator transcription factor [Dehalococcoidales bacterium]|nr:response regulator transcription factor [Dehalococcoidales bacterium]